MRELIGIIPTDDPNVTEEVYLSNDRPVTCLRRHPKQVPLGEKSIEVESVEKVGEFKKVRLRRCYCREHGAEFETRARGVR
jgi:hypothetical protein